MHILQIATELAPVAKVGGLADVLYGLSKELAGQGHTVEILLPKYDSIDYNQLKHLKVAFHELWSFEGGQKICNTIWSAELHGLKLLLLEPHHPQYYFSRGKIYGCPDDAQRFLYFSRAALEYLHKRGKSPDVVHIHDWPLAAVAPLYKEIYAPLGLSIGGVLFTIHNLEYQGICAPQDLARVGLRGDSLAMREKPQDSKAADKVNLLKAGIEYADLITTVSPTYEKEIKTKEQGCGLDSLLIKHSQKLKGVLNGIDTSFWNPASDPLIFKQYATENMRVTLQGKAENRNHLAKELSLSQSDAPLVACITRLVYQKGPELIYYALKRALKLGAQFVLLGSNHNSELEDRFVRLKKELEGNRDVAICLDKDEALAHQIYASSDMLIIPSIFEPCGLTQLIALRYGTVPLARMTGGLADTVYDIDTSERPLDERNGFTFEHPTPQGVDWALERAIDCFTKEPKKWQKIIQNGLKKDVSWKESASQYAALYAKLTKKRPDEEARRLASNE